MSHLTVLIDNNSSKKEFIKRLLKGDFPEELKVFKNKKGVLFSLDTIEEIIEEEAKRDYTILSTKKQRFETMSSGEQKKMLLSHLLNLRPEFIILDNPFDNLDVQFQEELKTILHKVSSKIMLILFISRKNDSLTFIKKFGRLSKNEFSLIPISEFQKDFTFDNFSAYKIPAAPHKLGRLENPLIAFKKVSVAYQDKNILNNIEWTVNKGDFWQLIGPNGSGKTTLLSMIIGDNPKAFGKDIFLFGRKKGSGESVWDIKKKLGITHPLSPINLMVDIQ